MPSAQTSIKSQTSKSNIFLGIVLGFGIYWELMLAVWNSLFLIMIIYAKLNVLPPKAFQHCMALRWKHQQNARFLYRDHDFP
jgi:hypothetical protein